MGLTPRKLQYIREVGNRNGVASREEWLSWVWQKIPKQKEQGESIPVPFIAIKVYEVNYLLFLLYRIFISLSSLDFQFFP